MATVNGQRIPERDQIPLYSNKRDELIEMLRTKLPDPNKWSQELPEGYTVKIKAEEADCAEANGLDVYGDFRWVPRDKRDDADSAADDQRLEDDAKPSPRRKSKPGVWVLRKGSPYTLVPVSDPSQPMIPVDFPTKGKAPHVQV